MESLPDVPVFPLRVIDLTASSEDSYFHNREDLGCTLEVGGEWDTDDPEMAEEALVLDAHNRRVRLKVHRCEVQVCELYDSRVWSEAEIKAFVDAMRNQWYQKQTNLKKQNWFCRIMGRLGRLWK